MEETSGVPEARVWLLGDSEPAHWRERLHSPLDPRHPARHSIWTPILDRAQRVVFLHDRTRFDDEAIFIRNAITNPALKPRRTELSWRPEVESAYRSFRDAISRYQPLYVLSFGSFAWEFTRRARSLPPKAYEAWGAAALGREFRSASSGFALTRTNFIPLLHASISRGRFLESHKAFCGQPDANYFECVGDVLARLLLAGRSVGVTFI